MEIDLTASTNELKIGSLKKAGLTSKALDLMCTKPLSSRQQTVQIEHKTLRELLIYIGDNVEGRSDDELYGDSSPFRDQVPIYLLLDMIGNTSVEFFLDNSDTRMAWATNLNNGHWERNKNDMYWTACAEVLFDELFLTDINVIKIEILDDIIKFTWDNIHNKIYDFHYDIAISEILDSNYIENLSWWLNLCKLAIYGISSNDANYGGQMMTKILVHSNSKIINIITYDKCLRHWNNLYNEIFATMSAK